MTQQDHRLYIIVDSELNTGRAAAQIAHAATVATREFSSINHETYIIVLSYEGGLEDYYLDLLYLPRVVHFREPDLKNRMTAIAVLDPPEHTFSQLQLWMRGGETNGD